jgi:uncharacterized protein (DUF58 family)
MKESYSRSLFLPGRTLLITSLLYLLLGCAAFFFETVFLVWLLAGIGLVPFILSDLLLLLLPGDRLQAERIIPYSLAQGEHVQVKLLIRRSGRPLLPFSIRIFDLYPHSMSAEVFPAKLDRNTLKTSDSIIFEYSLLPNERGPWFFSGVEFLLGSPMRFWRLRVTHNIISRGRTYPNFKQMARGTELKGKPESGEIRQIRKRGHGLEFESLRDYQEGDSIRSIDWMATGRNYRLDGKPKLIVRNYQEEQDQQILFIIDSGYRLPDIQFDSALEAMLLLSYTAIKHGDAVAAASFGARNCWIPPRKGMSAFTGLMNSLYDLHSEPVPSSPFTALENALNRLHRRSFIILVSNFREEDGESLKWILPSIKKRHLLLMVSFRESGTEALAFPDAPLDKKTDQEVLETAAAFSYLANRRRLYRKWEHSGLLVLETSPAHISSALINKYLSVKRSGTL